MSRSPRSSMLAAILIAFLAAPSAHAATVLLELWTFGPGNPDAEPVDTWKLMASASSSADNDGISGYNIDLVNIGSADNMPPLILVGGTATRGFTVGGADLVGDGAVFAGQNSTIPSSLLYHVGEPGFPGPDPSPDVGENVPWGLPPILLATGTGPWELTDFGASTNVNVWSEGQASPLIGGTAAEMAEVSLSVIRHVPEPSPSLLVAAAVASITPLLRWRRR